MGRIIKKLERIIHLLKYSKTIENSIISKSCVVGEGAKVRSSIVGEGSIVAPHSSVRKTTIGKFTGIGRYTKVTHSDIGSYCAISWDNTINAIEHPIDHLTISAFPYAPEMGKFVNKRTQTHKRVQIKNDVWIGCNVVILPGIKIGNGVIIGAGSVVNKDIPDYSIASGAPAKVLKYRFEEETIERLLKCNWWNLEKKIIKTNINLFQGKFTAEKLDLLEEICKKNGTFQ